MNIALIYVYPTVDRGNYSRLAHRFADTYRRFPAGCDHSLHVYCNGPRGTNFDKKPFDGLPVIWRWHDNTGWDIGAYQRASEEVDCDLMVCVGSPVHFWREGWLARMADAYVKRGSGIYGIAAFQSPFHIRTTCFWMPPGLFRLYPSRVINDAMRREFETGKHSITRRVLNNRQSALLVTWTGIWESKHWETHFAQKHNILIFDQHIHK